MKISRLKFDEDYEIGELPKILNKALRDLIRHHYLSVIVGRGADAFFSVSSDEKGALQVHLGIGIDSNETWFKFSFEEIFADNYLSSNYSKPEEYARIAAALRNIADRIERSGLK